MEKKPYHDDSVYVDDDFDSFESSPKDLTTSFDISDNDDIRTKDIKKKLNYKTDTENYNSLSYEIISPEEATAQMNAINASKEKESMSKEYADPVMAKAVHSIEEKFGRKITYDEFDKLCKTYAAELVNRDAEYRGQDPNPVDYKMYYDVLIQNKKIKPAYKMHMENYEHSMVSEIDGLLEEHKVFDQRDLHIRSGDPINVRHQGKVFIRDEDRNREIIINNKNDVDLLRMQYREEWLQKKYKNEIDRELNGGDHSDDGFE